jgi:hypothetical protein
MPVSLEEQEKVRSDLQGYLEGRRSPDVQTRDQTCGTLGDFFEYRIGNVYKIDQERFMALEHEIRAAMEALIALA